MHIDLVSSTPFLFFSLIPVVLHNIAVCVTILTLMKDLNENRLTIFSFARLGWNQPKDGFANSFA